MLWAQAGLSFLVWCLFGVWAAKRVLASARTPHPALGVLALIGGALLLVSGLVGIAAGRGLVDGVLAPWAWAAVTVLGALFVYVQAWGALAVASRAFRRETGVATEPSVAKKDPS
ncbi:MAG: hypothetical protein JST30_05820 [Armatimonadetes bacterium]|nr:hypothetical protein [Armatimonadota bacterium]